MDIQSAVAHTCNPIHVFEFSWTIENISRISLLNGPPFSPIPKRSNKFYFQLQRGSLDNQITVYVYLHVGSQDNTFNFTCDVILYNANGTILHNYKCHSGLQKKKMDPLLFHVSWFKKPNELEFIDLPGDKLILKANFSISGYGSNTEMCNSAIKNSQVSHSHSDLLVDLKTMFTCGYAHDVTFDVDGKTIPAHTAILCSRSPVFAKMFKHDMLEKKSKTVVIKDIDFSVFNAFLLFLYTGEIEKNANCETVISLYSVADLYEVPSLRKECSRTLADNMAIGSVCKVLELADLHVDLELKETAKTFLRRNFTRVVDTTEWGRVIDANPRLASEILRSIKSLSNAQ